MNFRSLNENTIYIELSTNYQLGNGVIKMTVDET